MGSTQVNLSSPLQIPCSRSISHLPNLTQRKVTPVARRDRARPIAFTRRQRRSLDSLDQKPMSRRLLPVIPTASKAVPPPQRMLRVPYALARSLGSPQTSTAAFCNCAAFHTKSGWAAATPTEMHGQSTAGPTGSTARQAAAAIAALPTAWLSEPATPHARPRPLCPCEPAVASRATRRRSLSQPTGSSGVAPGSSAARRTAL